MSVRFDRQKDSWVCTEHGECETGWVQCYAGCDDGEFDEYEDDPINNDEGDYSICPECHGEGGFRVCLECNRDNPDVEV